MSRRGRVVSGTRKPFDESKVKRAAGGRFGDKPDQPQATRQRARSSVASPVQKMRELAERMHGRPRAEILAAAEAVGVNRATATAQLYRYQRDRAARELQQVAANPSQPTRQEMRTAAARAVGVRASATAPTTSAQWRVTDLKRSVGEARASLVAKGYRPTANNQIYEHPDGSTATWQRDPDGWFSIRERRAAPSARSTPVTENPYALRPGERPVAGFRRIADAMAGRPRSEVIATAAAAGINRSTASVQYTAWARGRARTSGDPPAPTAVPNATPSRQRVPLREVARLARMREAIRAPQPTRTETERVLIRDGTPTGDLPRAGTPERQLHDELRRASSVFPGAEFTAMYANGKLVRFNVRGQGVNIQRGFNGKTVDHSYFELAREIRGDGAKKFLAETVETYKKAGYEKIKVHANIDVGGYAWLRYGFQPDRRSREMMRGRVAMALEEPRVRTALGEDGLRELKRLSDAGQFERIAAMTTPIPLSDGTSRTLGKVLFLNTNWYGDLPLNNDRAMSTFRRYAGVQP